MMNRFEPHRNQTTSRLSMQKLPAVQFSRRELSSKGRTQDKVCVEILSSPLTNELLASLPEEELTRLFSHLEPVTFASGEDLYRFGEGVRFAYFPESVVLAQLHVLEDGNTTEAIMIGREGLAGLSAIFDAGQPNYWTRVLVAGSALRMPSEILQQEFRRGGALQHLLLAYTAKRLAQLSQRAVCNGRHRVEERLCTWLLMVHDRARKEKLQLTHEQIAAHLGTRRAGITTAATLLRDRGIISYSRGQMRILNRQMLINAACECYAIHAQMAGVN